MDTCIVPYAVRERFLRIPNLLFFTIKSYALTKTSKHRPLAPLLTSLKRTKVVIQIELLLDDALRAEFDY